MSLDRVVPSTWRGLSQGQKTLKFTHPIFESDFDCLTGNGRFQALLSVSPLASYKLKPKEKKILRKKSLS